MSNKIIKFVLTGRVPSKKNSRLLFARQGKIFNIPSKQYKEWHAASSLNIKSYKPKKPIHKLTGIVLSFYSPDKRESDLTNKAESIMDLLVDNGFLKDDNWFIVNYISLYFKGVDKENPRCEIVIYR